MPSNLQQHEHANNLHLAVGHALSTHCDVLTGDRILIGVSGGADSTALLHILANLARKPHWELDLHVIHVNHHLRTQADSDQAFVESLCASLKIPCHTRDIHPADQPGNLESNARDLRYKAILNLASEIDTDHIATAHHADDQLETLLMRLIRGTSIQGLCGIRWKRTCEKSQLPIIRPLLRTQKTDLTQYLNGLDHGWVEDATNQDTTRLRARLRHHILPELREIRPDVAEKFTDAAETAAAAHHYLTHQVAELLKTGIFQQESQQSVASRQKLAEIHFYIRYELLRQQLITRGCSADSLGLRNMNPLIYAISDDQGQSRTFQFEGGFIVSVDSKRVCIENTA